MRIRTALVGVVVTMSAAYAAATGKPKDAERDPNPPTTLSEALDRLERTLPAATIREMSDGTELDMVKYHFSVGLWMRNYWGLWARGPLSRHLRALGLRHPDDMSGLILTCFWRRLHGKPLGVEEQVARYEEYWRLTIDPDPGSNSACKGAIRTTLSFGPNAPVEHLRGVHMGTCCADGVVWSYHVDRGWYRPVEAELAVWNEESGRYDPCKEK